MAPKAKGRGTDLKQEDVLQAVVIADSFNVRFAPITQKKPRVGIFQTVVRITLCVGLFRVMQHIASLLLTWYTYLVYLVVVIPLIRR
jgi:hypothetical protein